MGKLDGKVAVITGGSTGMALAGAKLFVEEGAHVFIQARRQEALDDAVKREKGSIDVLWASAGMGRPTVLGEITEEQFHRAFWLNARGTLFTVQKALPLINDNGSIFMTESNASLGAFPGWSLYAGSKAVQQAWARVWLNELRDRKIRVNVLTPGQVATAKQEELFDEATKAAFESLIPRGKMGRPEEIATRRPVPRLRRLQLRQRPGTGHRRRHHRHLNHTPGMPRAHPTTTQSPQRTDLERGHPQHAEVLRGRRIRVLSMIRGHRSMSTGEAVSFVKQSSGGNS